MVAGDPCQDPKVVTGMMFVNNQYARSFVSIDFRPMADLKQVEGYLNY